MPFLKSLKSAEIVYAFLLASNKCHFKRAQSLKKAEIVYAFLMASDKMSLNVLKQLFVRR